MQSTGAPWHTRSATDVVSALSSDAERGLSGNEVRARSAKYGLNQLAQAQKRSLWTLLLYQFRSLIVLLLVSAAAVAVALGDVIEAAAIFAVIILNAAIGFFTEWKARSALNALREQSASVARVIRDGREEQIDASALVPGDVVLLSAGDRVPADGRLLSASQLKVDEAALTGESMPVSKTADAELSEDTATADQTVMVHMGTGVSDGRGTFVVTATGAATEMGKIGTLIEGVEVHGTPLEAKLSQLSRTLLWLVLGLCAIIVFSGWLRGNQLLYMLEVGISLAIAAVPEGLLAVTTMTLAIGMQRMARFNALVRRLPAVESLGSTTVICSDKTGTLTRNQMTVRAYDLLDGQVTVTGAGYDRDGTFEVDGAAISPSLDAAAAGTLELALRIGVLCNDARVSPVGEESSVLGDPTEIALLVAAQKGGLRPDALLQEYPRIAELPFRSETKLMVTVHRTPEGGVIACMKGSPSAVLDASVSIEAGHGATALSDAMRATVLANNEALASSALRVLAFAWRELPADYSAKDTTADNPDSPDPQLTTQFSFVGLVGMSDPLREEASATIATCQRAGIRTIMLTGDQQATAAEIARQLGLDKSVDGTPKRTVHARELHNLTPEGWLDAVRDAAVFARVSPEHKLQIVDALQRQGHVVAMTGDGVNDAPALRKADIGIAMGLRGTEVAKESAAMVITDDNFATIVRAIEQGRIIVHNLLRFIHFLFSCNFAEIATVFAAIMVGWPLPLGVLQILWLNLVTDIFPAMALALEPSAPDVMTRPPRDPDKPLMSRDFAWLIAWQGMLLSGCTLAAFGIAMRWYGSDGPGLQHAITIAFMTLALSQTFHAFNARSRVRSAFSGQVFANAWLWGATVLCIALQIAAVSFEPLRQLLRTVPLTLTDWTLVVGFSLAPVLVVELVKLWQRQTVRASELSAEPSA